MIQKKGLRGRLERTLFPNQARRTLPANTTYDFGPNSTPLAVGLVGFGAIGRHHAEVLANHPAFHLTGITAGPRGLAAANQAGLPISKDLSTLLAQKLDVIVVATPHPSHAEIVESALRAGCHVLCEKPLTLDWEAAQSLNEIATSMSRVLATVFQTRFRPEFRFVREIIETGRLGRLFSCMVAESSWRNSSYYASEPWRATFSGEGGGTLVNQAPHLLDRYGAFAGWPSAVIAFTPTILHKVEVEDTIYSIFKHDNGLHGSIRVTTAEAPWTSRVEVVGENGRVVVENGRVDVAWFATGLTEARDNNILPDVDLKIERYSAPKVTESDLFNALYDDFALACAGKRRQLVDGAEAGQSVALMNAIRLAAETGSVQPVPPPRGAHAALLAKKRAAEIQ